MIKKAYGKFYPENVTGPTLKRELETLDLSAAEVRQSVFMYVEAYYNRLRLHSTLDYVAPKVFNSGQVA
jgi:transposase InsO family protein